MSPSSASPEQAAAFFDVDGTLARTTIVHYYIYFRRRRMSAVAGSLWYVFFVAKCLYFLILDKIDRSRLNVVFYRSYAGLPVAEIKALAGDCHRDVVTPRFFEKAAECIEEHRQAGRMLVFVTGSIAFIIEPLARQLGVTKIVAPSLVEANGRFTGELDGPPVSDEEKARRIKQFADDHRIDLSQSYAYGDSIADLPMLKTVAFPHAVNPDKALASTARSCGWPIHRWTVAQASNGAR
jgi:HAD superfamily hydrolase (TIGR01490 family)